MFITALFGTAESWKQPKCPFNEILLRYGEKKHPKTSIHATSTYLKIIILNEISLTKKSTCYTIPFILNSRKCKLTYSDGADGGLPGEWGGWRAEAGAGEG